jgi:hypothetical protein
MARWIAKHPQRCVARFIGVHSGSDVFCNLSLQMELQLFIELCAGRCSPEKGYKAHSHYREPAHLASCVPFIMLR